MHNTAQMMDDLDATAERYTKSLVKLHAMAAVMRIILGEDASPKHLNLIAAVEDEFTEITRGFSSYVGIYRMCVGCPRSN